MSKKIQFRDDASEVSNDEEYDVFEDARRSSSARDLVGRLAVSSTAAITASASASAYLTRAKLTLTHRAWQI